MYLKLLFQSQFKIKCSHQKHGSATEDNIIDNFPSLLNLILVKPKKNLLFRVKYVESCHSNDSTRLDICWSKTNLKLIKYILFSIPMVSLSYNIQIVKFLGNSQVLVFRYPIICLIFNYLVPSNEQRIFLYHIRVLFPSGQDHELHFLRSPSFAKCSQIYSF